MKDLKNIGSNLMAVLQRKKDELMARPDSSSYDFGQLKNSEKEVMLFQKEVEATAVDPKDQEQIFEKFERDAREIMNRIGEI